MNTGLAGPAEALHDLLLTQPLEVRASLYADWESRVREPRYPGLAVQRAYQARKINRFLRGMTSEEGRSGARRAAWALNSAPTTFFAQALKQAFDFPNLVPLMVEACKNGSSLSKDVLLHTLLSLMADRARGQRLEKEDGRSRATWLSALGTFVGLVARKHWSSVSLEPVWQAVAVELSQGTPQFLHLLQTSITEVSGVEAPPALLTPLQLACLGGSDTLRRQSLIVLVDLAIGDSRSGTGGPPLGGRPRKAATHLLRKLALEGLIPVLFSLVDHERRRIPYAEEEDQGSMGEGGMVTELVRVSYLHDWMAEVQAQLGEFVHLVGDIPMDVEDERIPPSGSFPSPLLPTKDTPAPTLHDLLIPLSLSTLCGEWGLSVEGGWMLFRRRIQSLVSTEESKAYAKEQLTMENKEGEKQKEESSSRKEGSIKEQSETRTIDPDTPMEEGREDIMKTDDPDSPYLSCLAEAMDTSLKLHLTPEMSLDLTPGFFTTFWQLSLRDLEVPKEAYNGIREKLSRRAVQLGRSGSSNRSTGGSSSQSRQSEKEKDRLTRLIQDLTQDEAIQGKRVQATASRLRRESRAWFTSPGAQASRVAERILQHCVRPRVFSGPGDARYCAALLWKIHSLGTPGFSTVLVLDNIFQNALVHWMTGATEGEAISLGVFLDALLSRLDRWHGDKASYDIEAIGPGILGFRANFHVDVPMKHGEFRKLLYKWHFRFSCFVIQAIESDDALQIKSAIHILRAVSSLFPRVEEVAGRIQGVVEAFIQRELAKPLAERRQDLMVAMQGYQGSLKVSQDRWISVRQFSGMMVSIPPQGKEDTARGKASEGKTRGTSRREESKKDDGRREEGEVLSPSRSVTNDERSRSSGSTSNQVGGRREDRTSSMKGGEAQRGETGGGARSNGRGSMGHPAASSPAPISSNARSTTRAGEGKKDVNALIAERMAALEAEKRRKKENNTEGGAAPGAVGGGGGDGRSSDRSRESGAGRDRPREREREREREKDRGRNRGRDRERDRRSRGSTRDRDGTEGRGNAPSSGSSDPAMSGASRKRDRPEDQGNPSSSTTSSYPNIPSAPSRDDPVNQGQMNDDQGSKRPRLEGSTASTITPVTAAPSSSSSRSRPPSAVGSPSGITEPPPSDHLTGPASQDRDWQHRRYRDSRTEGRPGQQDTRQAVRGGRSAQEPRGGHRGNQSSHGGPERPLIDSRPLVCIDWCPI